MLRIDLISIFPEYLAPLKLSLLGKAADKGLLQINIHDLRDQTTDTHHSVDDTPYGGGAEWLCRLSHGAVLLIK